MAPLRLLTFSSLFPNLEQPNHGIFVENRLRHLLTDGAVQSAVVAPVPYFPVGSPRFGEWAKYARVPRMEMRGELRVHHPRFLSIPRIGMSVAPYSLYLAAAAEIGRLIAGGLAFDAIDAHYVYPDGVAALWLGRRFDRPVVVTARGSDISQLPDFAVPRALIKRVLAQADALIAVSSALRDAMLELGAAADRVTVLRNGVDLEAFQPVDRASARRSLGLSRTTLLSVGHLIERKGHHRVIEALAALPDCDLLIAGEGPERGRLTGLIAEHGLDDRVRLLGSVPHGDLAWIYGAADILILASSREGWANVLLESMACGTPVVASPIWGNPEVVREPAAGLLAERNTPESIAEGVRKLLADPPTRAATRAYAEGFSWQATTDGQLATFRRVIAGRSPPAH